MARRSHEQQEEEGKSLLRELPKLSASIRSHNGHHITATRHIRKLLLGENPPIQQVVESGVVPRLVEFLGHSHNPKLQAEAAWALTNIVSGESHHVKAVTDSGGIQRFVRLLAAKDPSTCEQAVWALGNIAGDSTKCRDQVLGAGVMSPLLHHLDTSDKMSMHRTAAWTLSNLCRGTPRPSTAHVTPALPCLSKLLRTHRDDEVLANVCCAMSYLCEMEDLQPMSTFTNTPGVFEHLVQLMGHASSQVHTAALQVVVNVCHSGDAQHITTLIDLSAMTHLRDLLTTPNTHTCKRAAHAISHITEGSEMHIQAVLDSGAVPVLVSLIAHDHTRIRASAMRAVRNIATRGRSSQVKALVKEGCVHALHGLLRDSNTEIVTLAAEALEVLAMCVEVSPDVAKGTLFFTLLAEEHLSHVSSQLAGRLLDDTILDSVARRSGSTDDDGKALNQQSHATTYSSGATAENHDDGGGGGDDDENDRYDNEHDTSELRSVVLHHPINTPMFPIPDADRVPIVERGVSFHFLARIRDDLRRLARNHANSGHLVNGMHTTSSATDWQEFDVSRDALCIKAATISTGVSFVEACMRKGCTHTTGGGGKAYFGRINTFISYAWRGDGITFINMVDALEATLERDYPPSAKDDFFFFVDIFVCSQHRNILVPPTQCPNAVDVGKFEEIIAQCERLIIYCFPLEEPHALKRVWCLYEVMSASLHGKPITVALSSLDEARLIQSLTRDFSFTQSLFGTIDAKHATATKTEDRDRIFALIEESIGFGELNLRVKNEMHKWIVSTCEGVVQRNPEDSHLATAVGAALQQTGMLDKARIMFVRALELALAKVPVKQERVATAVSNLGSVDLAMGDYVSAEECFERALEIDAETLPDHHPNLAHSQHRLGEVMDHMGQLDLARDHYAEALAIRKANRDIDPRDVACSHTSLGCVECALGNFEDARAHHEKAFAIRWAHLGPNHIDLATSHGSLANLEQCLGNYDAAREHEVKALAIREGSLPASHPDIAASHSGLGAVEYSVGNYQAAKVRFQKALAIRRAALPPTHPDISASLCSLGNVEYCLRDYVAALAHHQKAMAIIDDALPENHPIRAHQHNSLGNVLSALGKFGEAKVHYATALEMRQANLPDNHPSVAISHNSLGNLESALGNFEAAREHHEKALEAMEGDVHRLHPRKASSHSNLGDVESALGNFEAAKEHYEMALAIRTAHKLPENHRDIATLYGNMESSLGFEALGNGDREKARAHFQQSLAYYDQVATSKDDPHVKRVKGELRALWTDEERAREREKERQRRAASALLKSGDDDDDEDDDDEDDRDDTHGGGVASLGARPSPHPWGGGGGGTSAGGAGAGDDGDGGEGPSSSRTSSSSRTRTSKTKRKGGGGDGDDSDDDGGDVEDRTSDFEDEDDDEGGPPLPLPLLVASASSSSTTSASYSRRLM